MTSFENSLCLYFLLREYFRISFATMVRRQIKEGSAVISKAIQKGPSCRKCSNLRKVGSAKNPFRPEIDLWSLSLLPLAEEW
jgi:hypothetical protein